MDAITPIQFVNTVLNFCIVPLIVVLWNLKAEIASLRVTLHEHFATKDEVEKIEERIDSMRNRNGYYG